jgi:hypothetical protein
VKRSAQIFLSYAHKDQDEVKEIYDKLVEAGHSPWMDSRDIVAGEEFRRAIEMSIRKSDLIVACLSTNSVDRRGFIQRELKQALDLWKERLESDIYIIPVRLDDCPTPESLEDFQWVNLYEEDGWERLVQAIETGIERLQRSPRHS